ncbi:4Fe-4S dicluster domain-containing protein [Gordonibacter sp.]|uniref:4Fe-4S dicluster domain-containing protein n=1 Tax=Gordonibacter sp. TaxID=1968902 RepID=UPI002FCB450A
MASLGFYFNQENCIGCRACQVACVDRNDLAVGHLYRRVSSFETGKYPEARVYHYSAACNHCEKPACAANCPSGALQKADDGTVQRDKEVCIGCGTCVESCPYEVPILLEDQHISGKCDSCKAFRDQGANPVCVDACPMRALDFGDLDELAAKHGGDLVSALPILPSPDETVPSLLVAPRAAALATEYKPFAV